MQAEMFNAREWIAITDASFLKHTFDESLKSSGFEILSYQEKHFKPFGYTGLWLLGESHFAVHTFPEHNKTYFELSSCVKEPYDNFVRKISLELGNYRVK